jgi:hypothetical protein
MNHRSSSTLFSFCTATKVAARYSACQSINGSDAITGVTFDGYSYRYELDNGMPVRQSNVTIEERLYVQRTENLQLNVLRSSAAIMVFCG